MRLRPLHWLRRRRVRKIIPIVASHLDGRYDPAGTASSVMASHQSALDPHSSPSIKIKEWYDTAGISPPPEPAPQRDPVDQIIDNAKRTSKPDPALPVSDFDKAHPATPDSAPEEYVYQRWHPNTSYVGSDNRYDVILEHGRLWICRHTHISDSTFDPRLWTPGGRIEGIFVSRDSIEPEPPAHETEEALKQIAASRLYSYNHKMPPSRYPDAHFVECDGEEFRRRFDHPHGWVGYYFYLRGLLIDLGDDVGPLGYWSRPCGHRS